MSGIAMQSMNVVLDDSRRAQTERELELLSNAIVGNPAIAIDGARSDFGYVGDVGAFPSNLNALYTDPGGLPTWSGPYFQNAHLEDTISYRLDAWGQPYSYSGGLTISSPGGGSTITKKLADATNDYLVNTVIGTVKDKADSLPGTVKRDSVDVKVTFPKGSSGMVTRTKTPSATGVFTMDSVPVGKHLWTFIYKPANDTFKTYYTVLPRHKNNPALTAKFSSAYFSPCYDSLLLRPTGTGSVTSLTTSGCSNNWQCVDEITTDEGSTYVIRASSTQATDVYAIANPPSSTCAIQSVTVYCRARKTQTLGQVRPTLYVGGTQYNGTAQNMTTLYADYSHVWTTNPNTSAAWTWTDITNIQAGVRMSGENATYPAYCTQVWIVVKRN